MTGHPPYPADTRAKGWRFELDHERIRQSDTWALATPSQRPWLLMLWLVAWEQTPCGSLPDSDELIAARLGMPAPDFQDNRAILLRGWQKASDGRLYHPVIIEMVLEMLARKSRDARRKADYRAKQKGIPVPSVSHGTDMGQTWESSGSDDTGTGTSKRKPSCSPSASESAENGFSDFWKQYPKKAAKSQAQKAWNKIKPAGKLFIDLMAGLERQKASDQWQKDGGQFIPHPATWLNQERWKDVVHVALSTAEPAGNRIFAGAI